MSGEGGDTLAEEMVWEVEPPAIDDQISGAEDAWAGAQAHVDRLAAEHSAAKDAVTAAFLELVTARDAAAQAEKEATKDLGQRLRSAIEARDVAWSTLASLVRQRARARMGEQQ